MASVTGAPTRQVVQFAQLASGRGDMPSYHNDLAVPVLGSDVFLVGEKPARRAAAFKNFLFPAHLGERESVRSTMVTEKGHMTVKRRLGDGSAQRVFCFKLPSAG